MLIDIPNFAAIRGQNREIIILRTENGETWKEHDNSLDGDDNLLNTTYGECQRLEFLSNINFSTQRQQAESQANKKLIDNIILV